MAMNVEGKTAIITGAGSGINFSFAKILLSKGCNVVIADLALRPEAEALVSQYPSTSPGAKAVFQRTDVTDWMQLDKMFEVAIAHFGGADIVCPGAGVYEPVRLPLPFPRLANIRLSPTAMVQLLASTKNPAIKGRSRRLEIRSHRHQHNAPDSRNPDGNLTLPLPQKARLHTTHHIRRRSKPLLPNASLRSLETRTQRLRALFSAPRIPSLTPP